MSLELFVYRPNCGVCEKASIASWNEVASICVGVDDDMSFRGLMGYSGICDVVEDRVIWMSSIEWSL